MRRECRERFPRHRFQREPLFSDPGMHHGMHVRIAGGENVPGIPGACGTRNFTYHVRGPYQEVNCNSVRPIANQMNIFHLEWEVHPSLLTDGLNPGGHKLSQWEMWLELIFFPSHCQNTVNTFQYDGLHDSTKVQHHPGNRQFCRPLTGVDGYEFCKFFLNGLKP